jgi:hypothetical protein
VSKLTASKSKRGILAKIRVKMAKIADLRGKFAKILWFFGVNYSEHVDHPSGSTFSRQNNLYPSPDMHDFLTWHFALNPKYQYNIIRDLGLVQPRIMWRCAPHESLTVIFGK